MSINFSTPIICCISEGDATARNFAQKKEEIVKKVRRAACVGITLFQIREKNLGVHLLFEIVRLAVETADGRTKILVNSRFDIAMAAGAHGVHLPSDDMPAFRVREVVGEDFIIGVSAHSLAEVREALLGGADFASFAPVFASPGKSGLQGLERLREVCFAVAPFPVLALGGIERSNIDDVLAAGATGYASIRYLNTLCSGSKSGSDLEL